MPTSSEDFFLKLSGSLLLPFLGGDRGLVGGGSHQPSGLGGHEAQGIQHLRVSLVGLA